MQSACLRGNMSDASHTQHGALPPHSGMLQLKESGLSSSLDEAGFAEQQFSTDAVPAEKRLRSGATSSSSKWCAWTSAPFERPVQRARGRTGGTWSAHHVLRQHAVRLQRTSQMIGDGDDALALLTPLEGRLNVVQRGRDVTLGPGEALLVLHGEACTVAHDDAFEVSSSRAHRWRQRCGTWKTPRCG